jgi:hypothetical protein
VINDFLPTSDMHSDDQRWLSRQQRQAKEDDRLRKELAAAAEAEAVQAKQRDMARLASERREAERQRKENERKAKADELIKREEERRNKEAAERERDAVKRRNQEKSLESQVMHVPPPPISPYILISFWAGFRPHFPTPLRS